MLNNVIFILEIIGVFSFAISGSMVAIKNKMDMFGVVVLGVTTSVGGGIMRDIILGIIPPTAFVDPIFVVEAIIVSIPMCSSRVRRLLKEEDNAYHKALMWMDTVGLAAFTVVGVSMAIELRGYHNHFLIVSVALFTAVGGGVIRDIMADNVPFIFIKDFYAMAALIGAILCVVLWEVIGEVLSMIVSMIVIVVIRYNARKRKWGLPTPKDE